MLAFIAPCEAHERQRHEDAGENGRERGAANPHGGQSPVAVDERVVPCPVEEICADVDRSGM